MPQVAQRVAWFGCLFSLECCVSTIGSISRDSLFLREFAASRLALLTLLLSLCTAYAVKLINQCMVKLSQHHAQFAAANGALLLAVFPFVSACVMLLFAWLSLVGGLVRAAICIGIYIWHEIAVQVLTQQFWDFCAKSFDVAQSKRFFGIITFGSTVGTVMASMVILPFVQRHKLPTEYNLIACAALQLLVALLLVFAALLLEPNHQSRSGPLPGKQLVHQVKSNASNNSSTTASGGTCNGSIAAEIQSRRYLKHLCFFELMATVARVLVDNTTLSLLSSTQDEDQVKVALTRINSLQSALMLPLQASSGAFFTQFGVLYGIAALPVTVFFFGLATHSSFSSVYGVILSRSMYNAISSAIFNPARELLWLPLNVTDRPKYKSFVCGPFRSISRTTGALLSMLFTSAWIVRTVGLSCTSYFLMGASVVCLLDALAARQAYAQEFYSSLKQGYLDLSSPIVDFTPDQIALVKKTLVEGAQNQVHYVLSMLSSEHISLFAEELRALFFRQAASESNPMQSSTLLSTRLRILQLHTTSRQQFLGRMQPVFSSRHANPEMTGLPQGVLNVLDLMLLIKEKSSSLVPRPLRIASILACGFEKYHQDTLTCQQVLRSLLDDEDRSVVVCAAVALLRSSDWMDQDANVVLQKMLYDEQNLENRVVCLRIVGKELPDLLGDGFLVYLLHHSSPNIVRAAVDCCCQSSRSSRMLIPALVKHLVTSSLRPQVVSALRHFDGAMVWMSLEQFLLSVIDEVPAKAKPGSIQYCYKKRDNVVGCLQAIEKVELATRTKLALLLTVLQRLATQKAECLAATTNVESCTIWKNDKRAMATAAVFAWLYGRDLMIEESVVDSFLKLFKSTTSLDETWDQTEWIHSLTDLLQDKIHEAYTMRCFLEQFSMELGHSREMPAEKQPLLIIHLEHRLQDTCRIVLKLLSTSFPPEFSVDVMIQGFQSEMAQVQDAIQEVLETLLPSAFKKLVIPLLFPASKWSKAAKEIQNQVRSNLSETSVVCEEILLADQTSDQLACILLDFKLQLHARQNDQAFGSTEPTSRHVGPLSVQCRDRLMANPCTKELLVETFHRQPDLLSSEFFACLEGSDRPLLSKTAICSCLRASVLFEEVCAIDLLDMVSIQPVKFPKEQRIIVEGDLASAMFIIASGRVQLHKNGQVLAELGYGACLGQAALLRHQTYTGNHISSASALCDSILLCISRQELDDLIQLNPAVAKGVLKAVGSAFRWLCSEPLSTIARAGGLPARCESLAFESTSPVSNRPLLQRAQRLSTTVKSILSVDRAAKSFLQTIGRDRHAQPLVSTSPQDFALTMRKVVRSRSVQPNFFLSLEPDQRMELQQLRDDPEPRLRTSCSCSSDPEYSHFAKCIQLKGSELLKNLDDEKVALVAHLAQVVTLNHNDVLYREDDPIADSIFIVVDGTVSVTRTVRACSKAVERTQGACFGEESFDAKTSRMSTVVSVGSSVLFVIPTDKLIELSQLHHDLMRVLLSWLVERIAESAATLVMPAAPCGGGHPEAAKDRSTSISASTTLIHRKSKEKKTTRPRINSN